MNIDQPPNQHDKKIFFPLFQSSRFIGIWGLAANNCENIGLARATQSTHTDAVHFGLSLKKNQTIRWFTNEVRIDQALF